MAFTGTNACSPGICTQEVSFSFEWAYTDLTTDPSFPEFSGQMVPGSSSGLTLGNLGFATLTSPGWQDGYIGFFGNISTTFDTFMSVGLLESAPLAPQIGGAVMYDCFTAQCSNDFFQVGFDAPLQGPVQSFGDLNYEVTQLPSQVPEAPMADLLLGGGLVTPLFFIARRKTK